MKSAQYRTRLRPSVVLTGLALASVAIVTAANVADATAPSRPGALPAHTVAASRGHATYLGHTFDVPRGWSVVDLGKKPATCVRFDVHALYLGTPSNKQKCSGSAVAAATGAILVEPAASQPAETLAQDDAVAQRITVTMSNVEITASYGADRAEVLQILQSAGVPTPSVVASAPLNQTVLAAPGASSVTLPQKALTGRDAVAGTVTPAQVAALTDAFVGLGFDTCTAPTADQMSAWTASPFAAIGVYIGGTSRACAQPALTASWVTTVSTAGWHLMPIYAGIQIGGITSPSAQAVAAANDAVAQASALGIGKGAVVYYDLEGGNYTAAQDSTAEAFLGAWTQQLHSLGYLSGVYGEETRDSGAEGVLVNDWGKMTEPDVVDIDNPNSQADDDPGADPGNHWIGNRVHQFIANQTGLTYGGVTITPIDQDYLALTQPCGSQSGPTGPQPQISLPCGRRPVPA